MNRFGLQIWEHLVRTRPADLTSIIDPTVWFDAVGHRIEAEITAAMTTTTEPTTARQIEAMVLARYLRLHPSDMVTDSADPLPESLTEQLSMVNTEVAERLDSKVTEPDFAPITTATEAWLARRRREIVVPVSMIDDPIVQAWRRAGHTITTRAV